MKTQKVNTSSSFLESEKIPVAIVGANGLSGRVLARLLLQHPRAQLVGCLARNLQWTLKDDLPEASAQNVPTWSLPEFQAGTVVLPVPVHSVFLATPPEVSMELAPLFLKAGIEVIDLSGAFRLPQSVFEQWYQHPHTAATELQLATYGLMPWSSTRIKESPAPALISNAGCYASSILMALIPLLQKHLLDPNSVVIDAKSGTSGAGLKAKENLLFTEVDEDSLPYKVGTHQHLPEIIHHLQKFTGQLIDPHFSTTLIPLRRGINASIYAHFLEKNLEQEQLLELIRNAFDDAYRGYPLVKHGPLGLSAKGDNQLLSLRKVAGSCRTHISYNVVGHKLYLFSTVDNLLKGAASGALENWNALQGFPLDLGLMNHEGLL